MKRGILFLWLGLCAASFADKGTSGGATPGPRTWKTDCQAFSAPLTGGYCIHHQIGSKNHDVVYHLHGRGGSENSWNDKVSYGEQLREYWKDRGIDAPKIVSVSFGKIWVLASKNASPVSGLFEVLTQQVIPAVEKVMPLHRRRFVLGESMGGFNAAQLYLRAKGFSKAAVICAPIADLSLDATEEEVKDFIEKSAAWGYYKDWNPGLVTQNVKDMMQLANGFFPTEADWKAANPLELAQSVTKAQPPLYLTVGMYDGFANYEGNQLFADALKKNGARVEWRPQWGGHCSVDIPSLAVFLTSP